MDTAVLFSITVKIRTFLMLAWCKKGVDSIMIEIVTDKDRNLKNLKQIGTPREEDKIYIENFAYAKIKENNHKDKKVFVLMGHTERMQGKYATFIEAAISVRDIEFVGGAPHWNNKIWSDVFREIKRLYEDMIIVGWALDVKGMSPKLTPQLERMHREHFGGAHQLLFLLDTLEQEENFYAYKENRLMPRDGFYIYHRARKQEVPDATSKEEKQERIPVKVREPEKKQKTQKKVTRESFRKVSSDSDIENSAEIDIELEIPDAIDGKSGKYRQFIQENKTDKIEENGNLGLAIAVAMLVFVVGVGVYENRGDIFGNQGSIETNVVPHETETETEGIAVEIISGSEEQE